MAYKSLISAATFDVAKKRHDCKANRRHTIVLGQRRLKVKEGRKTLHYCLDCARKILMNDDATLKALLAELDGK